MIACEREGRRAMAAGTLAERVIGVDPTDGISNAQHRLSPRDCGSTDREAVAPH
jgi:hypothetical protein